MAANTHEHSRQHPESPTHHGLLLFHGPQPVDGQVGVERLHRFANQRAVGVRSRSPRTATVMNRSGCWRDGQIDLGGNWPPGAHSSSCWMLGATPTMVSHGAVSLSGDVRTRAPSASPFGKCCCTKRLVDDRDRQAVRAVARVEIAAALHGQIQRLEEARHDRDHLALGHVGSDSDTPCPRCWNSQIDRAGSRHGSWPPRPRARPASTRSVVDELLEERRLLLRRIGRLRQRRRVRS